MASLIDATLDIPRVVRDAGKKTGEAVYTVRCTVVFAQAEICLMKMCPDGYWYGLDCMMWGRDTPPEPAPDDRLFVVGSWRFPGWFEGSIEPTYLAERTAAVPEEALNEDPIGRDEIYARFSLWNMVSNTIVAERETNTFTGSFRS